MSEATTGARFQRADLPLAYDTELVPRVFDPWAQELLQLVHPRAGEAALDVACGPGTVARQLARKLGPGGQVTGVDLSEPMLEVARSKPTTPAMAPITWVKSPAAPLDVASGAFDIVTCQQGLQFFPDRAAALVEMHRALKPGGRVAVAVWSDPKSAGFPNGGLRERLIEHLGEEAAVSSNFGRPAGELSEALAAAGFTNIRENEHTLGLDWTDPDTVLRGLAASPFQELLGQLTEKQRTVALAELRTDLERQTTGGRLIHRSKANLAIAFK